MRYALPMPATESIPPEGACGGGVIEKVIRRYVEDDSVVFVFPTEIAASMWQERALGFHPLGVLPDERFLPWDRFKSLHAGLAESGKSEVTERTRELYAESLAERSASIIPAVIPPRFAKSASLFSPWIAGILPHLALWEERRERLGLKVKPADGEDEDIAFILEDYRAFLERSRLFEPGWCRRFEGGGKRHIIFFCEAIQGFGAYMQALGITSESGCLDAEADALPDAEALKDFTAVKAPPFAGKDAQSRPRVRLHADFRKEFRRVALKIEELLAQGEGADGMAVSLSDAEKSAPYLARELETRGIPFRIRFGRPIAETGAGRTFPLIQQCGAEDFSFSSVKKLLSLKSVAWLSPELPDMLIQFGIENRCLCSWQGDGKDAWESAFSHAPKETDFRIKEWYKKLKENVEGLCRARSFAAVRKAWFAFSKNMLDLGKGQGEGGQGKSKEDIEIGRCIKELDALVEAEQSCPELEPKSPFSFFVARLKKTTYVPQGKEGGVSLFKLNDAAAAPFKFHFVTGATQEDATPLHSELRFLRKDKRDALDKEEDASLPMFSSHISGAGSDGRVFFSASERGVDGYKTVHSAFAVVRDKDDAEDAPIDPLEMEERQERPPRAYPVQKAGFEAYSALNGDKAGRFSFLKAGFEGNGSSAALGEIRERLDKRQKNELGEVRVSESDLKDYAACPAKWFMEKALELDKIGFAPELDLVDAGERGTIFHKVFARLYEFIAREDGAFRSGHAGRYMEEAQKIIAEVVPAEIRKALGAAGAESPLAGPSIEALAAKLKDGAAALVSADSGLLDGFVPVATEKEACSSDGGIEYRGRIDRISKSGDGRSTVIVDYKTGKYPSKSAYEPADGKIEDFQMPFYAFLCENGEAAGTGENGDATEADGKRPEAGVTQAWFFSVKDQKYAPILNTDDGAVAEKAFPKAKPFKSREEFAPAIEAMRAEAARFAESVNAASFRAEGACADTCEECAFRIVCRRDYSVAQD